MLSGFGGTPAVTSTSGFGTNSLGFGNNTTSLFGQNKLGGGTTSSFGNFGTTGGRFEQLWHLVIIFCSFMIARSQLHSCIVHLSCLHVGHVNYADVSLNNMKTNELTSLIFASGLNFENYESATSCKTVWQKHFWCPELFWQAAKWNSVCYFCQVCHSPTQDLLASPRLAPGWRR